jgi:Flp pilus assembly protein TadG
MKKTVCRGRRGAGLVEFALVLPLLLILIVNVVNFGGFFFDWITVENAARTGAQYAILGGASVTSPREATAAQVAAVVAADLGSLKNSSSYKGQVCTKTPSGPGTSSATVTTTCTAIGAGGGSFPAAPSDTNSEADRYVMTWIDVTYTFNPLIPLGFKFPRLNLYATLPGNLNIHRRAVMRKIR